MRKTGSHRVVITGMGWVTPLGSDLEAVWRRLLNGESAIGPVTHFRADTFATNFAAQVNRFDLAEFFPDQAPFQHAHLNARFALAAAARAWAHAGLGGPRTPGGARGAEIRASRDGVYLGAGEGIPDFENFAAVNLASWDGASRAVSGARWSAEGYARFNAAREIEQEPNMAVAHVAHAFGCQGPAFNCMTACAASTQAVGEAFEIIRRGDADLMLAGGAHSMIHPLGFTGFIRLTAMSKRRDTPTTASRPFDASRDGFVMGEGAGMLVLESLDHARARGATPLVEIAGYGSSADAYRITDIQPEGEGARAAMLGALRQAGLDPVALGPDGRPPVHYISAHGTGTQENDAIETKAVKSVFGASAPRVPFSSVKSMLGHLIQAAGAVELMTCVLAIRTGWIPPTINLHTPDPECDLDHVANTARDLRPVGGVAIAMSNSFGFGGQNDTILVRRFEP